MDRQIVERFHDGILAEAAHRYGFTADDIRPIDAFESFIFEFERDGSPYILRLSHSMRRSEALILGEVDWINTLADADVPVARAVLSPGGRLVEPVPDGRGGHFLATAFVKAKGRSPWDAGWTPEVFETYGRLMGSMHALAQSYRPSDPAWRRPEWDDPMFEFPDRYLPHSEAIAREKYTALCARLRSLPKDERSYGLIHQDAHGSNMVVDDAGRLTLFDFDECAYSWFANDIAIALFYTVTDADDYPAFTRQFMTHFLRGYRVKNALDPVWLREIPHFLKLREIEMYAVIHRDFDPGDIGDEWCARFMSGRKERIEADVPYIDFDFTSLAPLLGGTR